MANNKVIFGNNILIDLTSDTITASTLAMGKTAHDASGNSITGTGSIDNSVAAVGLMTTTLRNQTITVKNSNDVTIATTVFNASGYAFVKIPAAGTYTFTVTY